MTPRPVTHVSRRTVMAAVLAVAAVGGCATARDAVVGIHPAPSEVTTVAPITVDAATTIVARVLDEATAARAKGGAAGTQARKAVMNGSALAFAEAAAKVGAPVGATAAPLTAPAEPRVLAMSKGTGWPRAILATTLDPESNVQSLHVLTTAAAAEPFVLTASVPMLQGAALPGLPDVTQGTEFLAPKDGEGLVMTPTAAMDAYAKALAFPKPTVNAKVSTSDSFATSLKTSAKAQAKALGDLAKLAVSHVVVPEQTMVFRLTDGGAVVFGRMNRVDRITLTDKAKELTIPPSYAKLVGRNKATKAMEVVSVVPVVLVVPPQGKVTVIGAAEQLATGKAE